MILRLIPVGGRLLDDAVASVRELRLVRRADGCYAEVADEDAEGFMRDLAYAGIQADPIHTELGPGAAAIPATAGDLRPAPVDLVVLDGVRIQRIHVGTATAEVLRRRLALIRPPSAAAQKRCRLLLRGDDLLFRWQRQAFVERGAVRELRRRSSLRPVIFDRPPDRWTGREPRAFASDGLLARWAFA